MGHEESRVPFVARTLPEGGDSRSLMNSMLLSLPSNQTIAVQTHCLLTKGSVIFLLTFLQEDFIGLKELDKAGRLELGSLPGYHMHFSLEEFDERVIQPYLTVNESRVLASR